MHELSLGVPVPSLLKHTSGTTEVSLVLLLPCPSIKPYRYRTSRPPALLKLPPCISLISLFLAIVIVRSTYSSRSQIVDSQGFPSLPLRETRVFHFLKQSITSSSYLVPSSHSIFPRQSWCWDRPTGMYVEKPSGRFFRAASARAVILA